MKELETWGGRSKFKYSGSVEKGTNIVFKSGTFLYFSSNEYKGLLNYFSGKTVNIGTSRTEPPSGSLGYWIEINFNKMGSTSFISSILINEGYAERTKNKTEIKFK